MDFAQMGKLMQLAQKIDVARVSELADKVDLPAIFEAVSRMDDSQLQQMTRMLQQQTAPAENRENPPIDSDFFDLFSHLDAREQAVRDRVRDFMEREVRPVANEYWLKDETPRHLIEKVKELALIEEIYRDDGSRREGASVAEGVLTMEMARVDPSIATLFGVHSGLALGSIFIGASEEQKAEWFPKLMRLEQVGAFGLTEPEVGSAVAGGLTTTCERAGDEWILNGQKKWIGNATFADFVIIWAREKESGAVRGFIVRTDNPGYRVEKILGKIALRSVENGLISLNDCRVPETDRLQKVSSFREVAAVLRLTRVGVAWIAVGCAMGAYEKALSYAMERQQFGRPIAGFQLIQDLLVRMLGNITAMQAMALRVARMQDEGTMKDEHASLAKMQCARMCRETVAMAREVLGGNGILIENDVARFFSDAEAIYSYEGTNEINTLVVGRAITGISAFI
jgi:glutaryl-CoA dehydrogenase